MADNTEKKAAAEALSSETEVKEELDNIFKQELTSIFERRPNPNPAPFLRSLSSGVPSDWTEPAVDLNRQHAPVGPIPSIPSFGYLATSGDEKKDAEKRVIFENEKEDLAIRKNQTFAGSLSEVRGHSDEAYPHVHHVMSRHRPHRPRKVIQPERVEKMPTIQDDSQLHQDHHHQDEGHSTADENKPLAKMFSVGVEESHDEEGHEDQDKRAKKRKKKHHHKSHFSADELNLRRAKGSELAMDKHEAVFRMDDSIEDIDARDLEDLSHHRFDHMHGYERHKISSRRGSSLQISAAQRGGRKMEKIFEAMKVEVDHTPHSLFVEMDELINNEWVEQARWIKYEEAREEGAERWGKPHVSSLSFHSLLNLRRHLERGVILLDIEARDMTNLLFGIVEEFNLEGLLEDDLKSEVLRILLFRHRYVDGENHGFSTNNLKRNLSRISLHDKKSHSEVKMAEEGRSPSQQSFGAHSLAEAMLSLGGAALSQDIMEHMKNLYPIMKRMPDDSEGCLTLCGALECLNKPMIAFVRLAEGYNFKQAMEVPIPLRFVIVVLTPKPSNDMDCHEVGRSFSTLMSNEMFHNVCYTVENKSEMLGAINDFLDESVVLPPGDWASKNLLSLQEIQDMRKKKKERREAQDRLKREASEKSLVAKEAEAEASAQKEEDVEPAPYDPNDPMQRAPYFFGGLINDIKRRAPHYLSDFKDGIDPQVLAATMFIYFAALSGAIAFGGLLGEKTEKAIGITETLLISSISGIFFSLFAGMPLIITGVTGPVLLFDEALFNFTKQQDSIDFLPWRVWVGIWLLIIALTVSFFQGSVLVKHFTKFTKDIFAALVSLLFIFEAFNKLVKIFKAHPLQSVKTHCDEYGDFLIKALDTVNESMILRDAKSLVTVGFSFPNQSEIISPLTQDQEQPNTALLSAFLMLSTFGIAYYLRIFRNGKKLGRTARRALGDFGVPIAIVIMVLIDYAIKDTYTEKLDVPSGLQVTDSTQRGWLINPFPEGQPVWMIFAAVVPAFLLYVLLFMETHICELLMMERTNAKGAGVHWDIVLLCAINCLGSFFGGPWICAATVRAVAHVSALTVMSTTHAPGEQPKIVAVRDQRLSFFLVSVLLGVSVLLSPLLKLVPYAVLFGVFLYMGVSSINGIQLFDRLSLLLTPVKHHPSVSYVRRVRTWKMHLYTCIQIVGLGILWAVKSTAIALFFPFFVVAMVPLRMSFKFFYDERELEALDGKNAGKMVRDDEPDFYEQGGLGA